MDLPDFPSGHAPSQAAPGASSWLRHLRRVGQVNASEQDVLDIDVEAYADYWASCHVDAVWVSAGGYLAFYPSEIPLHRRVSTLNGRDFFGEVVTALARRGIRTVARLEPGFHWRETAESQPEWFVRDKEGQLLDRGGPPTGLHEVCANSPYHAEYIRPIIRELVTRYELGGVYANGWPWPQPPPCHCQACRRIGTPDTPGFYQRYFENAAAIWREHAKAARQRSTEVFFSGNRYGQLYPGPEPELFDTVLELYCGDNQGRRSVSAPVWFPSQLVRAARATHPGRPVANSTAAYGHGGAGMPVWRQLSRSSAEAEIALAQIAAGGGVMWWHIFGMRTGLGLDHRHLETGRRFFSWQARHDRHFSNRRSLAEVAVVLSSRTRGAYRHPDDVGFFGAPFTKVQHDDFIDGMYSALLQARIPFDFINDTHLDADTLRPYRALVLPNIACLSDAQCDQLRAFVAGGGALLATYETSLYDERGQRRDDFGLSDVLDARLQESRVPTQALTSAFMWRREAEHPLTLGLGATTVAGASMWRVRFRTGSPSPFSVCPMIVAYPNEISWNRDLSTGEPAVSVSRFGRGRAVYLGGDVERTWWLSGHPDPARLIANALEWLLDGRTHLRVTGTGLCELRTWETDAGYALHVLNYSNPNLHRGAFVEHIPIGPLQVTMELPSPDEVLAINLLRKEQGVPFVQRGSRVEFTIPSLDAYEVVAMETGRGS